MNTEATTRKEIGMRFFRDFRNHYNYKRFMTESDFNHLGRLLVAAESRELAAVLVADYLGSREWSNFVFNWMSDNESMVDLDNIILTVDRLSGDSALTRLEQVHSNLDDTQGELKSVRASLKNKKAKLSDNARARLHKLETDLIKDIRGIESFLVEFDV